MSAHRRFSTESASSKPRLAATRSSFANSPSVSCHFARAWNSAESSVRSPEELVRRFGAVQAQDYPGSLWAIGLRVPDATATDVWTLIRTLTELVRERHGVALEPEVRFLGTFPEVNPQVGDQEPHV